MSAARTWSKRWLKLALLVVMMLSTIGMWEVFKVTMTGSAYADGVGHLKCYAVTPKGPSVNEQVTLADQFGREDVVVRLTQLLCTPVIKLRQIPPLVVP